MRIHFFKKTQQNTFTNKMNMYVYKYMNISFDEVDMIHEIFPFQQPSPVSINQTSSARFNRRRNACCLKFKNTNMKWFSSVTSNSVICSTPRRAEQTVWETWTQDCWDHWVKGPENGHGLLDIIGLNEIDNFD